LSCLYSEVLDKFRPPINSFPQAAAQNFEKRILQNNQNSIANPNHHTDFRLFNFFEKSAHPSQYLRPDCRELCAVKSMGLP
jgi:hypothetical protein